MKETVTKCNGVFFLAKKRRKEGIVKSYNTIWIKKCFKNGDVLACKRQLYEDNA